MTSTPISFCANDDVEIRYHKTSELSKHPERNGSRAYFAFFPRICTAAEVKLKKDRAAHPGCSIPTLTISVGFAAQIGRPKLSWTTSTEFNRQDPLPTILMGIFNAKGTAGPYGCSVRGCPARVGSISTMSMPAVTGWYLEHTAQL
jgi:hypothetical protein